MTRSIQSLRYDIRHPRYLSDSLEWESWRLCYEGGRAFRDAYLKPLSDRETPAQFTKRSELTPVPAFAKAAVIEVRNSIFQRLVDVTRSGGSAAYQSAVSGDDGGVDLLGSSMTNFMGNQVLTELLVMGRCGVYVDAKSDAFETLADGVQRPYVYLYCIEDILSWNEVDRGQQGQFKAVLLRDRVLKKSSGYAEDILLPSGTEERYRLVYLGNDGKAKVQFFNEFDKPIFVPGSDEFGVVDLGLPYVPFFMPDIGESLMKDITSYQIALLNMLSGNVNFDMSSNTPFLTIQEELRTRGAHLRGSADGPDGPEEVVGGGTGRYYNKGMDRPDFVAPPTGPIEASMKLQDRMKDDIRRLVALNVESKSGSRTESGEAKKLGTQALEAGLSFIGTVLHWTEQQICSVWALYESLTDPNQAVISYPSRYSLREDKDRIDDASRLADLMDTLPTLTGRKEVAAQIVTILFSGKVSSKALELMIQEIWDAKFIRSGLEYIIEAKKSGLVGDKTASQALGFAEGEVEAAAEDHAARLQRILAAQSKSKGSATNPAARGVEDLDPNIDSAKLEQQQ